MIAIHSFVKVNRRHCQRIVSYLGTQSQPAKEDLCDQKSSAFNLTSFGQFIFVNSQHKLLRKKLLGCIGGQVKHLLVIYQLEVDKGVLTTVVS